MSFKILTLQNSDEWQNILSLFPENQQDIYYTPQFYRLYEELGDGKAICCVYQTDDGISMYPFLLNSVNELGYKLDDEYNDIQGAYGYNGIISSSNNSSFIREFYMAFNEFCIKENIIAEFTRFHSLIKNHKFSEHGMDVYYNRKTVFLDLSLPEEEIWETSYSSINRNMIRKAIKNGVEIRFVSSPEEYMRFYDLYKNTMAHLGALEYYYFSEDYFWNFYNNMSEYFKVFLAHCSGEIIAGAAFMFYGNYSYYHLSGRKREYSNFAPNNLILHEAINYAKSNGYKYMYFGGGNTTDENDPLFKFKKNFSNTYADFYIGKKIHNPLVYNQVVAQWEQKFPEKKARFQNFLLKYRY